MTRRQSIFAYFALLVGVVSLASSFAPPSSGQGARVRPPEGRFQLAAAGSNSSTVFVIDTHTGHTWSRGGTSVPWIDLGVPPGAEN